MDYEWIKTNADVYRAIYKAHKGQLTVFESYTSNCEETDKLKSQITAWGFSNAKHPIIKSEMRNYNEWTYSLLLTAKLED
jgi:hypothetical protein